VKGLVQHDLGRTFRVIRDAFKDIGYSVFYKVLNSKDFGVPQNRERIYIVAFREDLNVGEFIFPQGIEKDVCIRDILDPEPIPSKYYISDTYVETLDGQRDRINNAHFMMVALDENNKPVQVPRLILQTEDEHLAWAHGEERRRIRNQRRKDKLDGI
jgi:site-specific DNA-cytosine methylase